MDMSQEHLGAHRLAGYKVPETAAEYIDRMDEPDSEEDDELLHATFENYDEATQRENDGGITPPPLSSPSSFPSHWIGLVYSARL